jgi:hypothetical protein
MNNIASETDACPRTEMKRYLDVLGVKLDVMICTRVI